MVEIRYTPVAFVHNGRTDATDAGWGAVESALVFDPAYAAGLAGLADWSHAIVVFHMHREHADDPRPDDWRRRPRGLASMPLLGVFAQRGRMRPNTIGVTTVHIVRVEADRLVVLGLDAIDGTPVLDVKPWGPAYDRAEDARVPAWFDELMRGYF